MQDALLNQQEYQLMDVCAPNADRLVCITLSTKPSRISDSYLLLDLLSCSKTCKHAQPQRAFRRPFLAPLSMALSIESIGGHRNAFSRCAKWSWKMSTFSLWPKPSRQWGWQDQGQGHSSDVCQCTSNTTSHSILPSYDSASQMQKAINKIWHITHQTVVQWRRMDKTRFALRVRWMSLALLRTCWKHPANHQNQTRLLFAVPGLRSEFSHTRRIWTESAKISLQWTLVNLDVSKFKVKNLQYGLRPRRPRVDLFPRNLQVCSIQTFAKQSSV